MAEPDLYSLLSTDDAVTAEEQTRALANALRRRQEVGTLMALSGGRMAAPGNALLHGAEGDTRLLETAATARAARRQAASMAAQKAMEDRRDFEYRQTHDAATLDEQKRAHAASLAMSEAQLEMARMGLGLREARENRAERKYEKAIEGQAIPSKALGGTFQSREGLHPTTVEQARKSMENFDMAIGGMEEVEKALHGVVDTINSGDDPITKGASTLQAVGRLNSMVNDVGDTLSAAYGQGKQSKFGQHKMEEQLGADLSSPTGAVAFLHSLGGNPGEAKKVLTNKVRTAIELTKTNARNKMGPTGMPFVPDQAPATNLPALPNGKVRVVDVEGGGGEIDLSPGAAAKFVQSGRGRLP